MKLNHIYKTYYDIRVFSDDFPRWWCPVCSRWVDEIKSGYHADNCTRDYISSNAVFKSRRKAFKEFERLTELGVDCIMNDRKIIFFKAWYFCNEWHSKDQDYFGCDVNN